MIVNHAHERLHAAVSSLARSQGSLQERLGNAVAYNLSHLREDEFPEAVRVDFTAICERMTEHVPMVSGEGTIAASARAMSDDEAERIIRQIVSLYDDVTQAFGRQFRSGS